ncbi:hypothetical protein SFUMM280S_11497 [Streptomyces fumanus]
MGTGTDAAIEAGAFTLVIGGLRAAADAIGVAREALDTIESNLFWAFVSSTAVLPLATAALLNPMIAGAAMAFSSVFVVGDSLRLRGFEAGRRFALPARGANHRVRSPVSPCSPPAAQWGRQEVSRRPLSMPDVAAAAVAGHLYRPGHGRQADRPLQAEVHTRWRSGRGSLGAAARALFEGFTPFHLTSYTP